MIDAREPRNGDYASYVENLVDQSARALSAPRSPGRDPGARKRASRRSAAQATSPAGGAPAGLPAGGMLGNQPGTGLPGPDSFEAAAAGVAGALRRAAAVATVAGIALIGLSMLDDPPFFAEPGLGILLIAIGAFINRFARSRP